nr:retrovirus-related Pol polyprotein from transposon TNT 1-94 [Tanacetum cinerariifolium]
MAFLSSTNSSTNGAINTAQAVNTANRVSTASTQVNVAFSTNIDNLSDDVICTFLDSQPNSPQLAYEDLEQIHTDDMEEMDLRWGHFSRECRAPRNQDIMHKESTRRSAQEGPNYALMAYTSLTSDSKVSNDPTCSKSCLKTVNHLKYQNEQLLKDLKKFELMVLGYKMGLESVEERLELFKKNKFIYLKDIKVLKVEIQIKEIAITELRRKLEVAQKEKHGIQLTVDKLENASKNEFAVKPVVENKSSEEETKAVKKNNDALIIKEWVSDGEEENVAQPKIVKKIVRPNIVKKERNRTLIEAARTMLDDFKLPTIFWAKAFSTACYVQNRVLVVKPHNKTPYKLFHGRTPTLSFMRPFGCPVIILNTKDHLGKSDGKADEGFFVGYSLNSKAFRVFNNRTRILEENLHIRFSKSTPNVVGSRPDWLFDIDALTRTMNYEPIVAGTQSNDFAGTKASDNACQPCKIHVKYRSFHRIRAKARKILNGPSKGRRQC